MAVTASQIKVEFPEFANTSTGLIDGKIADAVAALDEAFWGGLYDQAVKYYACDLIAQSPSGEQARLSLGVKGIKDDPEAVTIYGWHYNQLLKTRGTARVI